MSRSTSRLVRGWQRPLAPLAHLAIITGSLMAGIVVAGAFAGARTAPPSAPIQVVAWATPIPVGVSPTSAVEPSPLPAAVEVDAVSPVQALERDLRAIVGKSGADVGIALLDLGGRSPVTLTIDATEPGDAASTYKLPLLMLNAERVVAGRALGSDSICFKAAEAEGGWFTDYKDGACYTRDVLAMRVGHYSDNTAAHMLVDNLGGTAALNAYARQRGTTGSAFYSPNTTTALDLARLWRAEASGAAGGAGARSAVYAQLEHTAFELGIPASLPRTLVVAHKVGWIGYTVNDAGVIRGGPAGDYVLAVTETGRSASAGGWALVAAISARVWTYERER